MEKFSKSNFLKICREALEFQLAALYPVRAKIDTNRINLVFLNHDRNFSTFLTINYLVKHGRVADIYTLSRSMFESIISMGILSKKLIMNDLERYQNYQFIEIYKTYSHIKKLGLEILSGVSKDQADIMEQKRNEYMHKFGTKLPTWTGKTLEENVRLVDADYPPTCNEDHFYEYLYCQVYRKGSQVTHASFAGLSKGVEVEAIKSSGPITLCRFEVSEPHLIFSCFHSLIIFLSSVRFLGYLLNKKETEDYFQEKCKYVIS